MSKILVTGGAGYVGSHFVKRAVEQGNEVVVVDNLSTGHARAVPEGVAFYEVDVRDRAEMVKILRETGAEAIVHFAASSIVAESMEQPIAYFDNNVYGMICLLDAMRETGVAKIVFSSSAAVYGNPEKMPIEEGDPKKPINVYGDSKLMMERMMKWADAAYGIRGVALRYFNVAGADESGEIGECHNPETHLVPNVLLAALGKKDKITMFGDDYATKDGFAVRDYVHPTDLADAHLLALKWLEGEKSGEFNLGSMSGFSVKEIVDAAEEVVGRAIPQEIGPRRAGDPDVLIANSRRAREVLGWEPKFDDIHTIIASAWKWMESHPEGFATISS